MKLIHDPWPSLLQQNPNNQSSSRPHCQALRRHSLQQKGIQKFEPKEEQNIAEADSKLYLEILSVIQKKKKRLKVEDFNMFA